MREAGVSRAPLIDRDLDHPVGHVHVLDLVQASGPIAQWARPVLALPETLLTLSALRRLQASKTKLAVVIDEHGGTAGIVTTEDIVEELVGEMADGEEQLLAVDVVKADGAIVLPGTFPIHRAAELDLALPPGPYVTVAGLMLERLGHLPEVGERVGLPHHDLTVSGIGAQSITAVTITARSSADHS